MSKKDLLQLVEQACKGNEDAFVDLCRAKGRDVLFVCMSVMGNAQDGEDAAQEVLIKMHNSISGLKNPMAFTAWLNKLIFTTCSNMRRDTMKQKYTVPLEEYGDVFLEDTLEFLPEEYLDNKEKKDHVLEIIQHLPYVARTCVILHYYEGMSYADVSQVMNMTENAVDHQLRKARKIIKTKLDEVGTQAAPMIADTVLIGGVLQAGAEALVSNAQVDAWLAGGGFAAAKGAAASGGAIGILVKTAKVAACAILASNITLMGVIGLNQNGVQTAGEPFGGYTMNNGSANAGIVQPAGQNQTSLPSSTGPDRFGPPQHQGDAVPAEEGGGDILPEVQSLMGRVYLDVPGARTYNTKYGLSGVKLEVVKADEPDTVIQTVYTMSGKYEGWYMFSNLEPGEYRIRARVPTAARAVANGKDAPTAEGTRTVWIQHNGQDTFTVEEGKYDSGPTHNLPVYYPASVSGDVRFVDKNGAERSEGLKYLVGAAVQLLDANQKVVAETVVGSDGSYQFVNPQIHKSGTYTLAFPQINEHTIAFSAASKQVQLKPGQSATVESNTATDTGAPSIAIQFTGGDCDCGHSNPASAGFVVSDGTACTTSWEITGKSGVVARGNTQEEMNAAVRQLKQAGAAGNYEIVVYATDEAGNQTVVKRLMAIAG